MNIELIKSLNSNTIKEIKNITGMNLIGAGYKIAHIRCCFERDFESITGIRFDVLGRYLPLKLHERSSFEIYHFLLVLEKYVYIFENRGVKEADELFESYYEKDLNFIRT